MTAIEWVGTSRRPRAWHGHPARDVSHVLPRSAVLLETLLALLLVTVCLGALTAYFSNSTTRIRQARLRTRALMLADTKLAEMQLGLMDVFEGTSGTFDEKPPKYYWSIRTEDTDVEELQRLTLTIGYDDATEGFELPLYGFLSRSLHFSYDKLKEIATDPSRMKEVETSGFAEVMAMFNEADFPGSEYIIKALMAGGVAEMMGLYNKIVTGKISPEELMNMAGLLMGTGGSGGGTGSGASGGTSGDTGGGTVTVTLSGLDDDPMITMYAMNRTTAANVAEPWTDEDTAGAGSPEGTATAPAEGEETPENGQPAPTPGAAPAPGPPGQPGQPNRPMTRGEAISEILRTLGRMARERR